MKLRQCWSGGVPAGKRQRDAREHELLIRPGPAERDDLARLLDPEVGERLGAQREAAHGRREVGDPRDLRDARVQREGAAGHRGSLTRRATGTTSGVPLSGSSITRHGSPKTSSTSSAVTVSAGSPCATIAPSRIATRCVA